LNTDSCFIHSTACSMSHTWLASSICQEAENSKCMLLEPLHHWELEGPNTWKAQNDRSGFCEGQCNTLQHVLDSEDGRCVHARARVLSVVQRPQGGSTVVLCFIGDVRVTECQFQL
jgi:hypothetical protein